MILLQILLSVQMAHAGNGNVVGNGGNTVTCPDRVATSSIFSKQIAVLDVAEGELLRNLNYQRLSSLRGLSLERAFPKAVRMFLPFAAWERSQFLKRFANRASHIRFRSELPRLTWFSNLQSFGCTVEQAAIQYGPGYPGADDELILDLSESIWNNLETDQKIALLFHEYLLKDRLLMHGACTISNIREMTGLILSDESANLSEGDWQHQTNQSCMELPG